MTKITADRQPSKGPGSWSYITIGVASMDEALSYWVDEFGFEIIQSHEGPDTGFAQLWSIQPEDILQQVLLRTPGVNTGCLHLVEFDNPNRPVREGTKAYDMAPKNLDVYIDNLPHRSEALRAKGFRFRADTYSEVTAADGTEFRELHLTGHDHINIVMLEIIGEAQPYSSKSAAGIGLVILTVPDVQREREFYTSIMGLDYLSHNLFSGPEIEEMVGLPKGAGLEVSIVGDPHSHFGRIEIVEYQQVEGANLFPHAKPKSLGLLHVNYIATNLSDIRKKLIEENIMYTEHNDVTTLYGTRDTITFHSPSGFRIDIHA